MTPYGTDPSPIFLKILIIIAYCATAWQTILKFNGPGYGLLPFGVFFEIFWD